MNQEFLTSLYDTRPDLFTVEDVDYLRDLSEQTGKMFKPKQEAYGWNLGNTINNFLLGFAEGFTTLPARDWAGVKSSGVVDDISYSVGSLLGFIGLIPGAGTLSKLGVNAFTKVATKTFLKDSLKLLPKTMRIQSVPMMVADKVMSYGGKLGIGAKLDTVKFLQQGTIGRDMLKSATHLGIASAVGSAPIYDLSPETFINQRLEGFGHGAVFGAGNVWLGNTIGKGMKIDFSPSGKTTEELMILGKTNPNLATELLKKDKTVNNIARGLSSAIIFGMPSTIQGYPLEMQVYEYLLNGFFGYRELNRFQKQALEMSKPYQNGFERSKLLFPEKTFSEVWSKLPQETKNELQIQADIELGGTFHEYSNSTLGAFKSIEEAIKSISDDYKNGKITENEYREITKNAILMDESVKAAQEGRTDAEERAKEKIFDITSSMESLLNKVQNDGYDNTKYIELAEKKAKVYDNARELGLNPFMHTLEDIVTEMKPADPETKIELQTKLVDIAGEYLSKKDKPVEPIQTTTQSEKVSPVVSNSVIEQSKEPFMPIDISGSKKKSKYFTKDLEKFKLANKLIAYGAKGTSTESYREAVKDRVNVGEYTSDDVVGVSVNGGKVNGMIDFMKVRDDGELDLAIKSKATIVADKKVDRDRAYNEGERLLAKHLAENGYKEVSDGVWKPIEVKPLPKSRDFEKFLEIAKEKGIEISQDNELALKKMYKKVEQSVPRKEMMLLEDFTIFSLPKVDKAGKENRQIQMPASPISKIVSNLFDVKKYTYEEKPISELSDEQVITVIEKANKKNKAYYFGKKQDSLMTFGDYLIDEPSKVIELVSDSPNYKAGRDEWIALGGSGDTFDRLYANNLELWRRMNYEHLPMEEALEYLKADKGKSFVTNPTDFNKRTQLINAWEARLSNEEMGTDNMKFMILNSTNKDGTIHGNEDSPYHQFLDSKGAVVKKLHEAGYDGGAIVRSDVFDKMLNSMGIEQGIGVAKGTQFAKGTEDNLGAFLGKLAWFRADKDTDLFMEAEGVDVIHYNTTVKQGGFRESTDWWFKDGKYILKNKKVYELPWDTISLTTHEHTNFPKTTVAKQYLTNIDTNTELGAKAYEALKNKYIIPAIHGKDEANNIYQEFLKNKDEAIIDNLEIDDLSLKNKLNILASSRGDKLWTKLVNEILNMRESEDEIITPDKIADSEYLESKRAIAKDILDMVGVTPATLQLPGVKDYYQNMLTRYIIETPTRPKTKNAVNSVLRPNQPTAKLEDGTVYVYRPDHFVFAKGMKEKVVTLEIKGKEVKGKLGDLWNAYGKSYPEAFEFVVMRTPADSASGIRVLKFDGFLDIEGQTVSTHSKEYVALGGADNDIDKVFVYFNEPKEAKNYYRSMKDQWYDKDGNFKDTGTEILVKDKQPLYKFSPLSIHKANKLAALGNNVLGPALSYGNRLRAMLNSSNTLPEGFGSHLNKMNRAELESTIRDAVNNAADSANGFELLPMQEIRYILSNKVYDGKERGTFKSINEDMKLLDSILRGYDNDGKSITLEKAFDLLQDYKKYNKLPFKNLPYEALHEISELEYRPKKWFSTVKIGTNFAEYEMLFKEYKDMKDLLKLALNRDIKINDEQRSKTITKFRKELEKDPDLSDKDIDREMSKFINELYVQDISDITSAFLVAENVKGLEPERVKKIRDKVAELKNKDKKKDGIRELIDSEIREFNALLDGKEKDFFHSLIVSSLRPSAMDKSEVYAKKAKIERSIEKFKSKNRDLIEKGDRDTLYELASLEESAKNIIKGYYASNFDSFYFNHEVVTPKIIKQWGKIYNAIVDRSYDNAKEKLALKEQPVPLVEQLSDKTLNDMVEIVDLQAVLKEKLSAMPKDVKLNKEIEKVAEEFKNILIKRPYLLKDIADRYAYWSGKTMDNMTFHEFKSFVNHLAKVGDKGLELQKRDFFRLPEYLQGRFEPYDDKNTYKEERYVYDRSVGKFFKSMISVPKSRMDRNIELGVKYNDHLSEYTSKTENDFYNHPLTKMLDSLGNDAYAIFEYAIRLRERGNNDNSQRLLEKAYANLGNLKDKTYNIQSNGKSIPVKFNDLVDIINKEITEANKKEWKESIFGGYDNFQEVYDKYIKPYEKNGLPIYERLVGDLAKDTLNTKPVFRGIEFKDYLSWLKTLMDRDMPIFEDGKIVGSFKLRDLPEDKRGIEYNRMLKDGRYKNIIFQPRTEMAKEWNESYYPHLDIPKKVLEQTLKTKLEVYEDNPEEYNKVRLQLELEFANSNKDDLGANAELLDLFEGGLTPEQMESRWTNRSANLQSRGLTEMQGYNTQWNAYLKYRKSLISDYWKGIAAHTMHYNVDRFVVETTNGKNNIGVDNAKPWAAFMRQGIRELLGYATSLPKEWATQPEYKIKGNPYHWVTEDYWARKSTIFDKFFGVKGIEPKDEAGVKLRQLILSRKIASLSNAEAKWSMMSLLFSPKTYLVNIMSANLNTAVGAGVRNFKLAGNLAHLRNINPAWQSFADIEKSVYELGGIESMIKSEVPLSQQFTSANAKRFIEKAIQRLQKNPDMNNKSLYEIAREEGLTQEFVDTAAFFMRHSERKARTKAWLAHYLKAREIFEATNLTFNWDDPWLVGMANKGVAATQFLYNDSMRPQFARTNLGKIYTRFQLFAVNSINWRKNVLKEVLGSGWNTEGEEYKKLQRMVTADVMVMSLASLLPYSLINSAIPPPFNYLQGITDFLFGDQQERERAFYGILPYPANVVQPMLPPSSRVLTSTLALLATGDYENFLGRQIWTWFPFGRFANDTRRALENPYLLPERMFGIPFGTLVNKLNDKEK